MFDSITAKVRFIPASAGNSLPGRKRNHVQTVHPRECGEQKRGSSAGNKISGSSPRVRGTGFQVFLGTPLARFIPASAGNSARSASATRPSTVHPRECGEQKNKPATAVKPRGSSPRVRGTVIPDSDFVAKVRFIPASAGNRTISRLALFESPVHPRECGEQESRSIMAAWSDGSSPRVRGTGSLCSL